MWRMWRQVFVSSSNSRMAASMGSSPFFIPPPGRLQRSAPRSRTKSSLPSLNTRAVARLRFFLAFFSTIFQFKHGWTG